MKKIGDSDIEVITVFFFILEDHIILFSYNIKFDLAILYIN